MLKRCTDCQRELAPSQFNKAGQGDRLRPQCKACQKERADRDPIDFMRLMGKLL